MPWRKSCHLLEVGVSGRWVIQSLNATFVMGVRSKMPSSSLEGISVSSDEAGRVRTLACAEAKSALICRS